MRVRCPECDANVRVPDDDEDRRVKCQECGEKFRPSDLDDDEDQDDYDDEPRSRRGSKSKGGSRTPAKKGNAGLFIIIGAVGGVGLLGIIGIVVAVNVFTAEKKPLDAKVVNQPGPLAPVGQAPQPQPGLGGGGGNPNPFNPGPFDPPVEQPPAVGVRPKPNPNPNPPWVNPEPPKSGPLDELFAVAADVKPPTTRVAILTRKPEAAPLDVPTFHSLMTAALAAKPVKPGTKPTPLAPEAKLTLDEVKQATVYIKVDAGDLSGTGSGFYIGSENKVALVATNHHVIEAAVARKGASGVKPTITCVFNSGVPADERPYPARVVAMDPVADLAVLRLDTPENVKLPKPLYPGYAVMKPPETTDVRICGFPFGEQLATATTNPNISVTSGTVSSLRMNKNGGLDKVQIDGSINPGNSGGPIVDKDGRLVGVAVSTIKGSGLGFAVPANDLIALLEGKILFTEFLPAGLDGTSAKFKVVVPVMDPRAKVQTVYVRYWAGKGAKPKAVKDTNYGHKPIENGQDLTLHLPDVTTSLAVAVGDLKLPADATDVVLQLASEQLPGFGQARGLVSVSAPVEYTLTSKQVANGSDARPLAEVFQNPAALVGQTVVARGKVLLPPEGTEAVQPLGVADVNGRVPAGLRFLAARDIATQFDEIDADDQSNDVRLVCVVCKPGPDGLYPVRVVRCDFLDEAGVVVTRSIPDTDSKDPLALANRDPARFADQKITFTAISVPLLARAQLTDDLLVLFPSFSRPRNLGFVLAPGLLKKVVEAKMKPNGLYRVRLTAKVGPKVPPGTPATATVSKIEILDPSDDNTVLKVIE